MPAAVELRNLRKSYGASEIIKGVSLVVAPSEFVVFVGPSGCGKSTLLRMIAGLEAISDGELLFDGAVVNDWDPARRRVGMVFQSYALYPHMTVEENIGFGLRLAKKPKAELQSRVEDALRILQLTSLRDKRPSQLSGGQRQRVAIGRAIVRKPNVFLFDEPLSNLDASLRGHMRMEIGKLHQTLKNTVIYVTHDQVEAMTLADRIVVFDAGIVRQIGTPMTLYDRPANRFVAGFIGTPTMGFLDAEVVRHANGGVACSISGSAESVVIPRLDPLRAPVGSRLTLGLRAEHCGISDEATASLKGTVVMLERLGADTFAFLDVVGAAEPVAVRLTPDHLSLVPGQQVGLRFDANAAHAFDSEGDSLLA